MDQNALVYTFGAVSGGSVALAFLYKWAFADRNPHDASWATAYLSLGLATALAAVHSQYQSDLAGAAGGVILWVCVASFVRGNLQFSGRRSPDRLLLALIAALSVGSIPLGLANWDAALILYTAALALANLWSALVLRHMPQLGSLLCAILVLRSAIFVMRPWMLDSPYLMQFSVLSFTCGFLAGVSLLAASLMRSRDVLVQSQRDLSRVNGELVEAKSVLTTHNELLHSQARKLERLSADYVTALERAEGANRAKDSFIANINHELRTPLNAIVGFGELMSLRLEAGGDEKLREYAGHVQFAAGALLKLINRILDYVAIESGSRTMVCKPFDPRTALEQELAKFRELFDVRNVRISVDDGQAPKAWVGDEEAFRSIILELISNAVKFAPSDSTVRIVLRAGADHLAFSIADQGPGLSDQFLGTVGEGFNISEPVLSRGGAVQGVGLGLSLAKRFVALVGGQLLFECNAPAGTTARVVFPGHVEEQYCPELKSPVGIAAGG